MTIDQRLRLLENVLDIAKKEGTWEFNDVLNAYNQLLELIIE